MSTIVAVGERPILFSGEMVRAILDGRKSQTRRVAKKIPQWILDDAPAVDREMTSLRASLHCPYGAPGDRLWVRETWLPDAPRDATWPDVEFFGCRHSRLDMIPPRYRTPSHCVFAASWLPNDPKLTWRPSIHMPRWASRITLEITNVRVERVQDIDGHDAQAEGINAPPSFARHEFAQLWDSLNAKRGYGWDVNPWVWVLEFKRVSA